MELFEPLFPALAVVVATLAVNTAFNDAVANLFSKLPKPFGEVAAELSRELNPLLLRWLLKVVQAQAEGAVKIAEAAAPNGQPDTRVNLVKKVEAVKALRRAAPGLSQSRASAEVESAYQRLKGAAKLTERILK